MNAADAARLEPSAEAARPLEREDVFELEYSGDPRISPDGARVAADSYIYQIRHQFPGPPWEHLEHYWTRSPLSLVGAVATPTMILTGEEDCRTPISKSEQDYRALQLVSLPCSSHGIASRPSRLISKVDHVLAWFARHDGE